MKTLLREHNNYGGSFRINSKSTQWELITLDVQERCVSLRLLGLGQRRAPLSLGSGFASAPLPQRFSHTAMDLPLALPGSGSHAVCAVHFAQFVSG